MHDGLCPECDRWEGVYKGGVKNIPDDIAVYFCVYCKIAFSVEVE